MTKLFTDLKEFKLCLNTLLEEDGLLNKRHYTLHKNYNNILSQIESINNENNYELIGNSTKTDSNYVYIYFTNNTNFLSKTNKTKNASIYEIKKTIKDLYKIHENINVNIIIILTRYFKMNTQILEKKLVEKLHIRHIQIFMYNYLLFNISKHKYVPQHIRIISNKDDIKAIYKKKNIENGTIAKILLKDPLANFYGLKVGELFEFKRPNNNGGIYIYYRLCIA